MKVVGSGRQLQVVLVLVAVVFIAGEVVARPFNVWIFAFVIDRTRVFVLLYNLLFKLFNQFLNQRRIQLLTQFLAHVLHSRLDLGHLVVSFVDLVAVRRRLLVGASPVLACILRRTSKIVLMVFHLL